MWNFLTADFALLIGIHFSPRAPAQRFETGAAVGYGTSGFFFFAFVG
jgi:hypothetical protein